MCKNHANYILSVCLLLASILITGAASANSDYIDGQDYVTLPASVRGEPPVQELIAKNPQQVQVLLFFSYGCSACAKFDPHFETWLTAHSNKSTVTYKSPVAFDDEFEPLSKLYFITQSMNPKQNLDSKIFDAIHQQSLKLWQESAMQEFLLANGYSAEQFTSLYNSADIAAQVKTANQLAVAYSINQTPTIIINGKTNSYKLNLDKAGYDTDKFFKIVEHLINKDKYENKI